MSKDSKDAQDLRLLEFDYEDNKVSLYIQKPSAEDIQQAEVEKAITFQRGIDLKLPLKTQIDKILKERGVWNEEIEQEVKRLQKELQEKVAKLDEGGIYIDDARKLALEINELRNEIIIKLTDKKELAISTADGRAEQAYLDYLIAASVVYNDDRKKKYFKDYKDYLNRKSDTDAFIIAQRYAEIMYDTVFDEKRLPENQFLIEYGFMNDKMQLINDEGHLIDSEGNLINENGELVKIVDGKDVVITQKRKPFLDKNNKPIKT